MTGGGAPHTTEARRWRLRARRAPLDASGGAGDEVVLWRPSFSGPLPEGTVVRCGTCGETDPLRIGHTPDDCIRALKLALAEAREQLRYSRAS